MYYTIWLLWLLFYLYRINMLYKIHSHSLYYTIVNKTVAIPSYSHIHSLYFHLNFWSKKRSIFFYHIVFGYFKFSSLGPLFGHLSMHKLWYWCAYTMFYSPRGPRKPWPRQQIQNPWVTGVLACARHCFRISFASACSSLEDPRL